MNVGQGVGVEFRLIKLLFLQSCSFICSGLNKHLYQKLIHVAVHFCCLCLASVFYNVYENRL